MAGPWSGLGAVRRSALSPAARPGAANTKAQLQPLPSALDAAVIVCRLESRKRNKNEVETRVSVLLAEE